MNANYYKSRLIELLLNEDGTWGELTESLLKLNFPKEEMDELLNKQYIWPKKDCYWINWTKLGSNTDYWEMEYKKLEKKYEELEKEVGKQAFEHHLLVDKYHHLTGEYNKVLIELAKAKGNI